MPHKESPEWLSRWRAAYSVLSMQSGGGSSIPIAVMLLDIVHERLFFRFRDDLAMVANEDSLPVIEGLRDEITNWAAEQGATSLYLMFLDTLSNAITISHPREVPPDIDLPDYLDRVFAQDVTNGGFARG